MKYLIAILIISSCVKSFAQEIEIKNLKKHVYFLADDKMKGRGTGSEENLKLQNILRKNSKNINFNL